MILVPFFAVPKDISHRKLFVFEHVRRRLTNMPFCPECGGEMRYTIATKRYACQSCGLTVSHQELIEMRDQMRPAAETEEEQRQKQRKEYLKWWLSSKKK
jgi:tRNA(Ile2) C34 agmatinyltransferase TiaS